MRFPAFARAVAATVLLAGLAPVALAGADTPGPALKDGEEWITGQAALEALVSGRTHYRNRSDGTSEIEYHDPDGQSAYVWDNCIERGQWWTTEREICFFYPDTALKGPHCFFIKRNAEEQLEFWWAGDPGALLPTATNVQDVEGNVERLPLGVTGECLMS